MVALSTTEAEIIAACEASKEVVWLKRLLNELTSVKETPILWIDNASAIKWSKNPEFHNRTKHIEVKYYFVREQVLKRMLCVKHIPSAEQQADILTKPLLKIMFNRLCKAVGINECG